MLVNRQVLGALDTAFHKVFFQNLVEPEDIAVLRGVVNIVPSTNSTEQYNWLVRLGKMREWIGPRVLNRFKAYGYTVVNKKWEDSVEVLADDIADDQLGMYIPQIQTMAYETSNHYLRLCTALLESGFSELAYDGQYYFDTDHPVGYPTPTTISNKGTLRITAGRADGLFTAFDGLPNLVDDRGDPLGIVYDTLLMARVKRRIMQKLLEADMFIHAGDTSIDYNEAKGIIENVRYLNYMSNTEKWFLVDTSRPVKPIVLQIRQRPVWQAVTNLNDSGVFQTDKFFFGVKARHNAGYNLWQLAYGSDGSVIPSS